MAKRDANNWPMVAGTLRRATFEAPKQSADVWETIVYTPLLLLWFLVFLLMELIGRYRVRFLYTYEVGSNHYGGYEIKFVRNRRETPKLFGRAPGETIFVRYDPQAPGTSAVLAEDNLQ